MVVTLSRTMWQTVMRDTSRSGRPTSTLMAGAPGIRFPGLLLLAIGLLASLPSDAASVALSCTKPGTVLRVDVPAARGNADALELAIDASVPAHAVLVVEETGVDLEWRLTSAEDFRDIDARPPRFGLLGRWASEAQGLLLRTKAFRAGAAKLHLYCEPTQDEFVLPACLAAPRSPLSAVLGRPGSLCEALVLHTEATFAARAGDNLLALSFYERAASAWRARADPLREGAARLGASEGLVRLGRYAEALEMADRSATLSRSVSNDFFAARAGSERCLSLRELGKRVDASNCQRAVVLEYLRIGEIGDAANAYISLGSMLYDDGEIAQAHQALAELDRLDLSLAPRDVVPRARMLRATLFLSAGRLSQALAELDIASAQFDTMGNGRWVANADLRIAAIYQQLGAWDESRIFARHALEKLPLQQASARRVEALRLLAISEVAVGEDAVAADTFAAARRLALSDKALLSALDLDLDESLIRRDLPALQRAESTVAEGMQASPRQQARLSLAHSLHAFNTGAQVGAATQTDPSAESRLALDEYLQSRTLRAKWQARAGDTAAALALIDSDVDALRASALAASAPGLRYIAGRRLLELRAAWIDLYTAVTPHDALDAEAIWRLLQRTQPSSMLGGGGGGASSTSGSFDQSLAALFLAPDDANRLEREIRPQRQLLRNYASSREATEMPVQTVAQTRALMPKDTELLVLGLGTERSLVLGVSQNSVEVALLGPALQIRAAARRLQESLASSQHPTRHIEDTSRQLSSLLLPTRPAPAPRLLLMLEDSLSAVPFALLQWSDGRRLVDTSILSLVPSGVSARSFEPASLPRQIQVLTASQSEQQGTLDSLPRASTDYERVHELLPGVSSVSYADAQFTRQRLRDALDQPGIWVHIAAHGLNDARLQSYSGLWLSAQEHGRPAFVSWLDIVERPLRAELAVLNACNLAGGIARGVTGTTNFAGALSAAGVRNVVAALWPLSDSAGSEFAKAFYAELARSRSPDVGAAVSVAQRHLRASPHFRHPYYWSLFVHLQR
jgi:CHAT domain-containing protein/tetratricopeptide (TPR) repeat protein